MASSFDLEGEGGGLEKEIGEKRPTECSERATFIFSFSL